MQAFARGLRKGTNSLIKGVVSGTLNSMAGVGDTLNRNVAMLGFDRCAASEATCSTHLGALLALESLS
jgi:hypothetical protein